MKEPDFGRFEHSRRGEGVTTSAPRDAQEIPVALAVRALVGSSCCLIVHEPGPDSATALDNTGAAVWQVGLGVATPASSKATEPAPTTFVASAEISPDLLVFDLRGIGNEEGNAALVAMLAQFGDAELSPRVALMADSDKKAASPDPASKWIPTLAKIGYFRTSTHGLDLLPADVALFKRTEDAAENIVERHRLLVETDRMQGLLARTIRLQDEADYWRLKFKHAAVPSKEVRRVADREAVIQAVARVKASRQYRIGNAVLRPLSVGRSLARRARRGI